jgi:hypothetical protein
METMDPTTEIVSSGGTGDDFYIIYKNIDGRQWKITGTCNQCGLCEEYNEPLPPDNIVTHTNVAIKNNSKIIWTRQLKWNNPPGTAGACEELDYSSRLDIPISPNLVNNIDECTLTGEWIN